MGGRPAPSPARVRAFAACVCLAAAMLVTGATASGKKPSASPDAPQAPTGRQAATADSGSTRTHGSTGKATKSQGSKTQQTQSLVGTKDQSKHTGGRDRTSTAARSSGSSTGSSAPATAAAAPASAPAAASPAPQPAAPTAGGAASRASTGHRARGHRHTARARRHGRAGRAAARGSQTARRPAAIPAATSPAARPAHRGGKRRGSHAEPRPGRAPSAVIRTFERVVRVVPPAVKAVIAVLAFLVLVAAIAYFLLARTNRYLARQRQMLLGEIGVLQAALLPDVPGEIGGLRPSVAYRPADGPAAGGDFYDAFPLDGGRVGILIGDITGHGRDALMRTSLIRHTLRAYLDAGLDPRAALQVGGRVLDRDPEELATVILATYDPATQVLRYASAGHPPPVFLGPADHPPVTQASSPPIGAGVPTGLRQTTISIPHGSAICLFTDGLIEARRGGRMIGRLGLVRIIDELGDDMSAEHLLDRVAAEADGISDDMAACLFRVEGRADVPVIRCEELEVRREDLGREIVDRFLAACGLGSREAARVDTALQEAVSRYGRALVRVAIGHEGLSADVLPANVESLAAAGTRRGVA